MSTTHELRTLLADSSGNLAAALAQSMTPSARRVLEGLRFNRHTGRTGATTWTMESDGFVLATDGNRAKDTK